LGIGCVEFHFFSNFKVPEVDYYRFWAEKAENDSYFLIKWCLAPRVLVQILKNRVIWDFRVFLDKNRIFAILLGLFGISCFEKVFCNKNIFPNCPFSLISVNICRRYDELKSIFHTCFGSGGQSALISIFWPYILARFESSRSNL